MASLGDSSQPRTRRKSRARTILRGRPLVRADLMVAYEDEDLIAAPREVLWKLLREHLDNAKVVTIHPLILSQKTVSRTGDEAVVDRVIDVNRKKLKSRWKITYHPPDRSRWELLESEGPWTPGSYLDITYEEAPSGTRVRVKGDLTVRARPFFLSQDRAVRSILNDLHTEDVWFLRRYRY